MGGSKLIESISKRLTNFFVRNGLIKEYDSEIYSYGFEMFVSEIISWLIIIPIAIISGEFNENTKYILIRTVADVIFYIVTVLIFLF